ncbi:ATP-binding cassette subfamily C protein PrsD [Bradyrhizobium elkanii]
MLQVYDRVLPSRSLPTLLALSGLALILFIFYGLLDYIRARILIRIGTAFDVSLSRRIYLAIVNWSLLTKNSGADVNLLRDLDQIRAFVTGAGPLALFDLPWLPIYIAICYIFHPWIGALAALGAIILFALTILSEVLTREKTKRVTELSVKRGSLAEESRRNASVLKSMGMIPQFGASWDDLNFRYVSSLQEASDSTNALGAISKVFRMVLQSAVLGLGAYLVINQQATGGVIIAGSIITARALAPLDIIIANWKSFLSARQSSTRLSSILAWMPVQEERTALERPVRMLSVESISAAAPGSTQLVVDGVSFTLESGRGLGILGPNASGKSSLAKILVGIWSPIRGKVRLDGAALDDWPPDLLARDIGYLPQEIELLSGTVAQNIARFEREADSAAVLQAAKAAGIHEMILRLPQAYETQIGEGGRTLSSGQRQRLALARALYRDPFFLVLDEPDSNLDAEGEEALTNCIANVRRRGGIVVVIAHRPSALAAIEHVLIMNYGRVQALRPAEEFFKTVPMQRPQFNSVTTSWTSTGKVAS